MSRLSVVDEIFLRTHRGMGTPIALQGLWRSADRLEPELLAVIHTELSVGPLGRRVVRPRIPGARRFWQPNIRAHALAAADLIAPAEVLGWADGQGVDLDPEFGPGWRLSAVDVMGSGSVVALTCSHALADGRALILAVDSALRAVRERAAGSAPEPPQAPARRRAGPHDALPTGRTHSSKPPELPPRHPNREVPTGAALDEAPSRQRGGRENQPDSTAVKHVSMAQSENSDDDLFWRPGPREYSDWADAAHQWAIVLGGTLRALRNGAPTRPNQPGTDGAEYTAAQHIVAPVHSSILQFHTTAWDRVAAEHNGTANSLFLFVVAKLLWHNGFDRETIVASVPVDTRAEPRVDNDLAMTEVRVRRSDTPATLRAKARAAYEHRITSPGGMPEEILQVIPDRWAHTLSHGAGERDILCSNLGTLPQSMRTLDTHGTHSTHHCTGVATRAIHPGLTVAQLPRTRLSGYLCRSDEDYLLALVDLRPNSESDATIEDLAVQLLTTLGIPADRW